MRPQQALDRHGHLLEVLDTSEPARELLDLIAVESGAMSWNDTRAGMVARQVANHLRVGETYHVDAAVADLIRARAEAFRGTAQFQEFPPPTTCGFLVFDEPFSWREDNGMMEFLHMVTWGPAVFQRAEFDRERHGTVVVFWNDARRDEDGVARSILGESGAGWEQTLRWTDGLIPSIVMALLPDMRIGPWLNEIVNAKGSVLADEARELACTNPARANPVRFLCAIWQLMDETITMVEQDHKIERHFRKRAEKRKLRPRVTVVTLRRTSEKGMEGARGPLEERHRVRPHKRKYWVGTGAGRHQEERWIGAHWSPNDMSLPEAAHTQKVYSLKR